MGKNSAFRNHKMVIFHLDFDIEKHSTRTNFIEGTIDLDFGSEVKVDEPPFYLRIRRYVSTPWIHS